jgi:hypothetical protein
MPNITYTDKDKDVEDGVRNKWRDVDANEVKTAVNSKLDAPTGGKKAVIHCGDYDASTVQFPAAGGTGTSGALEIGNEFDIITGSVDPALIPVGCTIRYKGGSSSDPASWRVYY